MQQNRDTKDRNHRRAERQVKIAGPFPFHRVGKFFRAVVDKFHFRRVGKRKNRPEDLK